MAEFDLGAVLVAALVALVLSSIYYAVFGSHLSGTDTAASGGTRPPPWKLGVEFLRSLILASVLAWLGARCEIREWSGGLLLGSALWIGFPLVLWSGAVVWEGTRLLVATVHLGDWLVKLLVVAAIVCGWS